MEIVELAEDRTAAERQRRYRQRLKEQGVQLVRIPMDKEARETLDRILLRRGYKAQQSDRQHGAGEVVKEALQLLDRWGGTSGGQE